MLDYKILTFLTLCDVLNYRETAKILKMTQPAVTQHIKALEAKYGKKLFNYEKRKLEKTAVGKVLELYSRSAVYNEKQLVSELEKGDFLHLKVGVTKSIEFILEKYINQFLANENNTLTIDVDNTDHLLKKLEASELDFALIEGTFKHSNFDSFLLRLEPFVGVCSKNHRFAGKLIKLDDLFEESLVLREDGSGTRKIFINAITERNREIEDFKRIVVINSFYSIKKLLKTGKFITFAYKDVAESDKDLACFEVLNMKLKHDFSIVKLKNTGNKEWIQDFLKIDLK